MNTQCLRINTPTVFEDSCSTSSEFEGEEKNDGLDEEAKRSHSTWNSKNLSHIVELVQNNVELQISTGSMDSNEQQRYEEYENTDADFVHLLCYHSPRIAALTLKRRARNRIRTLAPADLDQTIDNKANGPYNRYDRASAEVDGLAYQVKRCIYVPALAIRMFRVLQELGAIFDYQSSEAFRLGMSHASCTSGVQIEDVLPQLGTYREGTNHVPTLMVLRRHWHDFKKQKISTESMLIEIHPYTHDELSIELEEERRMLDLQQQSKNKAYESPPRNESPDRVGAWLQKLKSSKSKTSLRQGRQR